MHAMDNAKVIEALEKFAMFNYFDKLINIKMHKITLFPAFAYTAAPNLSDPQHYVLVDDLEKLTALNGGCSNN